MKIYKFVSVNLANVDIASNECAWAPNQDLNRKEPVTNNKVKRVIVDCNHQLVSGIVVSPSNIAYMENGLQHNLYGPAIIYNDIDKPATYAYKGYFTDCKTQEEFEQFSELTLT